jgi:hypothetical protein
VRLGHVTHVDCATAEQMRELGLWADVNLTSNLATGVWWMHGSQEPRPVDFKRVEESLLADHAVVTLANAGVSFVVGTDGGGVEHSTMEGEYRLLARLGNGAALAGIARRLGDAHDGWMRSSAPVDVAACFSANA